MAEEQAINSGRYGNAGPTHVDAARPEFSRETNRRLLLNLIRIRQPLSRADLARASGLARGTVSMIVQQLIEDRWVAEGPIARLPLGRRPTLLRVNDERMIVGVDLKPTEANIALSDLTGQFGVQQSIELPRNRTAAMAQLIARIRRIVGSATGKSIEGIGVCVQGDLNGSDFDVGACIADATGVAVEVDSAANACALASAWLDKAMGEFNQVVVTVSEEIQAGIFTNGQLVRGRCGMAGNYGHVQLDPNGPACECGGHGCWTVLASNRAALRYYTGPGKHPRGFTFVDLLNLADRGDTSAVKAAQTMAHWLSLGFRMIVGSVAPDCIFVVGDVTRSWDRLLPPVMAGFTAQPLAEKQIPCIVPVRDGAAARLRDAVSLVLQRRFARG